MKLKSKKGQAVLEYVLLLSILTVIAFTLITQVVSRQEGGEGFLISAWKKSIQVIVDDCADGLECTK